MTVEQSVMAAAVAGGFLPACLVGGHWQIPLPDGPPLIRLLMAVEAATDRILWPPDFVRRMRTFGDLVRAAEHGPRFRRDF